MTAPLSRRGALSGAATIGVSLPLLAACGDDPDTTANDPATSEATPSSSPPASSPTASETGGAAAGGLVATADVPVGSGVILKDEELVVAQPSPGEFKAFTAICTHQGCMVSSVVDGTIVCKCHNSQFSVADGSVTGGPAQASLTEVEVTVDGDQVTRA